MRRPPPPQTLLFGKPNLECREQLVTLYFDEHILARAPQVCVGAVLLCYAVGCVCL